LGSINNCREVAEWAPLEGALKWTVDGTAFTKPGLSGIGGVLRNCNGMALCMFVYPTGVKDSNEAEIFAILKG